MVDAPPRPGCPYVAQGAGAAGGREQTGQGAQEPCRGSFPETSSLWLKSKQTPKPLGIPASATVSHVLAAEALGLADTC